MPFALMPPSKERYVVSGMRPLEATKYHKGYRILPIFMEYDEAVDFKVRFLTESEFDDYRVYEVQVNLNTI